MKSKGRLEKTIYTREYNAVLKLLKQARESAGLTQVELAKHLGQTQSFVSKAERGDRRLDIIQLRTILRNFDVTLPQFVAQLEAELTRRT
jgi:transcriptional regulator with XRE-family HTH domain